MREFVKTHTDNSQESTLLTDNTGEPIRGVSSFQHPIDDSTLLPGFGHDFSAVPVHTKQYGKSLDGVTSCSGGPSSKNTENCNVVQHGEKVSNLQQHVEVSITEVDPSNEAKKEMKAESNLVGLAWPECVRVKITARRSLDGTEPVWRAHLTGLVGWYSRQTILTPTQEEVSGIGGNTTKENFCEQVKELKSLGFYPGRWYMLSAVKAHENVHVGHFKQGLQNVVPELKVMFNKWTVPMRKDNEPKKPRWISRAEAVGEMIKDPMVQQEAWAARNLFWKPEVDTLIKGDHSGPTAAAEHKVVDPMIKHICNYAKRTEGWPECLYCSSDVNLPHTREVPARRSIDGID